MQDFKSYFCLPKQEYSTKDFKLRVTQEEDIEDIRVWRNAQLDVLRQPAPISQDQQKKYFSNEIWPSMQEPYPKNILFTFFENKKRIGYGGLVHIAWEHRRAEISFLLANEIAENKNIRCTYFSSYLKIIKEIAFRDLNLYKITTETYAIRPDYIKTLEKSYFYLEGRLRKHVIINGRSVDSLCHSLIRKKETKKVKVLVSSASRKIPLIKSILEAKDRFDKEILVYAGDINKDAHAQFVCDGLILLPATSVENFEEILNLLKENQIELVIPTRDGELEFWATHRKALEKEGIQVIVSEPEAITTSLDKLAFAKFGEIKGFPIIPAWEHPQGKGPFVVKERYGAGSRSIGLNIETLDAALEWGAKLAQPIYQPFIEGKEISVDAWLDKTSKVKGLVLRERNQVAQGESVVTTTFRDTRLEAQCTQLLEALPLHGPVVLQVIIDSLGNPHIIELNARFGGASTASVAVGLDIWYWTLLEWDNQNLDLVPYLRSDKEARQIRVPQDILLYDSSF